MSDNMFSKKCDSCGIHPAMLFFRIFNNDSNSINEEGLCPKCALKKFSEDNNGALELDNKEIIDTINQMRTILSDIVGQMSKVSQKNNSIEKCHSCGISSSLLKKEKKAGCSICYLEFSSIIGEHLEHSSFSVKHQGQIPSRYRQYHLKNMELEKLKIKLNSLLRTENYEEAAKIKKRISKLETSQIYY